MSEFNRQWQLLWCSCCKLRLKNSVEIPGFYTIFVLYFSYCRMQWGYDTPSVRTQEMDALALNSVENFFAESG